MTNYLGVDVGGTNARYGLVTAKGRILSRGRFPVRAERGPEPIIQDLIKRLRRVILDLPPADRPQGLALGMAGRVVPAKGLLVFAPNLPGWKNVPVKERFEAALKLEVRLENDANLYALGEWLAGAGRGLDNLLVVTLGTGVGGGLILKGRLWEGAFGSAAEIGHVVVEPLGRPCLCGGRGCLETIASASAMARMARAWIADGDACAYSGPLEDLTSAKLTDMAHSGDPLALQVFDRAGWALGVVLADVFNLLGLEGVIIGGGAAPAFEFLLPRMRREFSERVLAVDPGKIRFARTELGDDAPLVGVPALFRLEKTSLKEPL